METSEKLLCRKELALRLRVSLSTVDRIIAAKEFPVIKVGVTGKRSRILVKQSEFERWLNLKTIPCEALISA